MLAYMEIISFMIFDKTFFIDSYSNENLNQYRKILKLIF